MKQLAYLDTPYFISTILDEIQLKVILQSEENQLIKRIPNYSTAYLSDITLRILKTYVDKGQSPFKPQPDDVEPEAIIQDNLMPSSINSTPIPSALTTPHAKMDPSRGSTRKRISSSLAADELVKNPKKRAVGQISQNLIPLQAEGQTEQDRIVKFLREKKQSEDKDQSISKDSIKKSSKKQGKEKKPASVTYDFNGEVILVRSTPPSNLVKTGLKAIIDANIHLNSFKGTNLLETVQLDIAKPKAEPVKKKKWAEISEPAEEPEQELPTQPLMSLPVETFELPQGARITTISGQHNQHSKRDLKTRQLLDNYKKIKMSRSQYNRIRVIEAQQQSVDKDVVKSKAQSVGKDEKKVDKIKKRSNSVMDLTHIKQKGSKVVVNNQELKDTYLNREQNGYTSLANATLQQKQTIVPRDQQVEFLLRKQPANPGLNRTRTVLVLPQIKHKLTITALPHKARERIKNQKEMLTQFHKRFEDRLRAASIKN